MSTTRQGKNNSQAKAIICLNTKQRFDTIKQAGEWCHSFPENISLSCRKNKYGYSGIHPISHEPLYWCLEKNYSSDIQENFELNKDKLLNRTITKIQKVAQIDLDTNEILNIFENCKEAGRFLFNNNLNSKDLNSKGKHISKCARGECNKAYGFKWRYINEITCS